MILNKYFLEEKRFAITLQSTKQHNTILQQRTHSDKLQTWWVCPKITFVSPFPNVRCPMSDVDAFGMWQTVKISSNHFSLR